MPEAVPIAGPHAYDTAALLHPGLEAHAIVRDALRARRSKGQKSE